MSWKHEEKCLLEADQQLGVEGLLAQVILTGGEDDPSTLVQTHIVEQEVLVTSRHPTHTHTELWICPVVPLHLTCRWVKVCTAISSVIFAPNFT